MGTARLLLQSSLAVGLGCASASLGSYYVENTISPPEFALKGDRFDQSSFIGRYAKMISNGDPSTLLATDADVTEAKEILEMYLKDPEAVKDKFTDAQLWKLRKLKESAIHPDTGEIVPRPFRMSGYVPFNGPICAAMMCASSTPALLFWNWVNQSQNALVNYFNRNASSPTSFNTLAISYAGAVTSAMGVAFGLSQLIKRSCSPTKAAKLLKFVAFPSSMIASSTNCYIMRRPELETGIGLVTEKGDPIDAPNSQKAAEKAVYETVLSRCLLQIPVFLVPALVMSLPPIVKLVSVSPHVNVPVMTLVTMLAFSSGLPATVAIFPQIGSIPKMSIEEDLQKFVEAETAYYNKGL